MNARLDSALPWTSNQLSTLYLVSRVSIKIYSPSSSRRTGRTRLELWSPPPTARHGPLPQAPNRPPSTTKATESKCLVRKLECAAHDASTDPLSEALLASATSKHKTLEFSNVVEFKNIGTLTIVFQMRGVSRPISCRATTPMPLPQTNSNDNAKNASSFETRIHPCSSR